MLVSANLLGVGRMVPLIWMFILGSVASLCFGQPSILPTSRATAADLHFTRAEIIERYDSEGEWRSTARKTELGAAQTDQLVAALPELLRPRPKAMTSIFASMRFQITFMDSTGKSLETIYVDPKLTVWWDERNYFQLSADAAQLLNQAAQMGVESPSVPNRGPAVRFEVIDREDGYGRLRRIPIKRVIEGKLAAAYGDAFPEIGLQSAMQLAHGGGYRFKVIVTFANRERHELYVIDEPGETWLWYEEGNYWQVRPSVAASLLDACQLATEDPDALSPTTKRMN